MSDPPLFSEVLAAAEPKPGDLDEVDLRFYRQLEQRWQDWSAVADACRAIATRVLERVAAEGKGA